jgi:adenylate kinase
LEENNSPGLARVIVVGVPGVGKTTVISKAAEKLNQSGRATDVIVFGSLMLDEARRWGVSDRDAMRKLSVNMQRRIQEMAASNINGIRGVNLFIDTHLFINTHEGRYPGIPQKLLNILSPTHLVMITADPEEIFRRRTRDGTRSRDLISVEGIKKDIEVSTIMIATSSVLTGTPFKMIYNSDKMINDSVNELVGVISSIGDNL